ncbi:MAG: pyridoxamine 5'-phosphate oxidase [Desulfobacterales bacterium CG23_combo_of_CG06-09_8_20_14_all_52_9]|nr:MAG: pyridoxamine 5'-phosphate oxidase [Desulfobacterales bacterium CG23_combo_of_CG06-09_8_20_14_all_52_9]
MMNKGYFEETRGIGVLATADAEGNVNAAVYARPHVMENGTLAFIMRDRLTHHNLQSNPKAAYLFMEEGKGYKGIRLHLQKVREEQDPEKIERFRRRQYVSEKDEARFLVYFKVEKELPLIGTSPE